MNRALAIAILVLAAGAAQAADVHVSRDGCGPLTVVAENALLSEVVGALAAELSFKHRVTPGSDVRITVDQTGSVDEVIAALARHRNVMLVRRTDDTCGDRVPSTFWVLDSEAGGPSAEDSLIATRSSLEPSANLPVTQLAVVEPPEPPVRTPPVADSPRRFETTNDQTPEQRAEIRAARRAARRQGERPGNQR